MTLTLTAASKGWQGNFWGTEAQWNKRGFPVRTGTPPTHVLSMVEATPQDTVALVYGVKRITLIRHHDEYAAIQVGDDDSWIQTRPNVTGIMDLVGGAFGGVKMSVPDRSAINSSEIASQDERWSSHLARAALRMMIETGLLPMMPEEMTDPDIIGLAVEIGTAYILNDNGLCPERIRDQATVRRWSALLVARPELSVYCAGLAQHAIDAMTAQASNSIPAKAA